MGGKRKYIKNFDDSKYEHISGCLPVCFIRQKENKLLFFCNRTDMKFVTLNLADKYTIREANRIIKLQKIECETVTLKDLEKEYKIGKIKRG